MQLMASRNSSGGAGLGPVSFSEPASASSVEVGGEGSLNPASLVSGSGAAVLTERKKSLIGALVAKTGPYRVSRHWGRRGRRILGGRGAAACYHVMSRTCGGDVFFDDEEKEGLRILLWKMCQFFGVELLTYCVMGNHFHALVRVPDKARWLMQFNGNAGEERLMEHLRSFYSRDFMAALELELSALRISGGDAAVEERLSEFKRRFCDLGIWMKELKERYSRWYNRKHERSGALWMGRFKSVLVESRRDGQSGFDTLRTMALYIDLNPVRAGIVDSAEQYRWSGYGEAPEGSTRARAAISKVAGCDKWARSGPAYRDWLSAVSQSGEQPTEQVLSEFGRITGDDLLGARVACFTEGGVVGSKAFVEAAFETIKDNYRQTRRAANPLRTKDGWLHVLSGTSPSD